VRLLRRLALVPLAVAGREQMPEPGRALVIASNHQSYLDALALIEALDRPIAFVAKRELASNPLVRLPLVRLGTLFVDRFDALRSEADADQFSAALAGGAALGFFPEGTFRDQPGLLPFHMGAFLAAARSGAPVLPVALRGTRKLMRGSTFFPRRGTAEVVIGEPVRPAADNWEAAVRLRDQTRAFIATHGGESDPGAGRSH
jgi:1-acyl-sn-glycerol-3-phosphate acyltransferase